MVVKYVLATLGFVLALPALLLVAVALGPVALGVLCAVAFGLIVFLVWNALLALGLVGRAVWRRGHHAGP
jgi:hypothetical protein